jgi:hypothetical protein
MTIFDIPIIVSYARRAGGYVLVRTYDVFAYNTMGKSFSSFQVILTLHDHFFITPISVAGRAIRFDVIGINATNLKVLNSPFAFVVPLCWCHNLSRVLLS